MLGFEETGSEVQSHHSRAVHLPVMGACPAGAWGELSRLTHGKGLGQRLELTRVTLCDHHDQSFLCIALSVRGWQTTEAHQWHSQ